MTKYFSNHKIDDTQGLDILNDEIKIHDTELVKINDSFQKSSDTSDDITEGTNNKYVTASQETDIDDNTTHRSSDGKDHSDVVLNNTHRGVVAGNPHSVTKSEVGLGNVTDNEQIAKSIVNTKGDIISASANNTPVILSVGADGKVLKADSGEANGLKWDNDYSIVQSLSSSSGVVSWDTSLGTFAVLTLTENVIDINITNLVAGMSPCLWIIQGSGPFTVIGWDTFVKWAGGTEPEVSTGNGEIDIIDFRARSSSLLYGVLNPNFS